MQDIRSDQDEMCEIKDALLGGSEAEMKGVLHTTQGGDVTRKAFACIRMHACANLVSSLVETTTVRRNCKSKCERVGI